MKNKINILISIVIFLACPIAQAFREQPYHKDENLIGLCTVLGMVLMLIYIVPTYFLDSFLQKKKNEWKGSVVALHSNLNYCFGYLMIAISIFLGYDMIIF